MCDLLYAALPWIFTGIEVAIIVVHFNVKKKKQIKESKKFRASRIYIIWMVKITIYLLEYLWECALESY